MDIFSTRPYAGTQSLIQVNSTYLFSDEHWADDKDPKDPDYKGTCKVLSTTRARDVDFIIAVFRPTDPTEDTWWDLVAVHPKMDKVAGADVLIIHWDYSELYDYNDAFKNGDPHEALDAVQEAQKNLNKELKKLRAAEIKGTVIDMAFTL